MHGAGFLQDLSLVLVAAAAAALLCQWLRQPKVLGYIVAGLLLGPHTPPFSFIRDEAAIRTLADMGVIFLMFSLGLEFNLRRFRKVGATAGVSAVLDVGVMMSLGYLFGRYLGWSPLESLFLGGILCDSSTTILAKTLQELGRTRDKFAGIVIGVTVVEDVLAVGIIAILTGIATTGVVQAGFLATRFWELCLFVVALLVGGLLTFPRLLNRVHETENDELLVLTLLGLCFGVALIADQIQLSVALGAVLVGAIASESKATQRLTHIVDPLRHMFSAIFFVAIGLMLDPAMMLQNWLPLLGATALVVMGKFLTSLTGSLLTGHDVPTSVRVGAGMAQVGEFAFIIAALGLSLNAIGKPAYQVGVGAAILTTILSHYLLRGADRLARAMEDSPACRRCTESFALYGLWIDRITGAGKSSAVRRVLRRSLAIVVINTILICAVMAVAGYLARRPLTLFPSLAARPALLAAIFWCLAMLVCLPLYVATARKIQAIGMILAELGIPQSLRAPWARATRTFLANAMFTAGLVGLLALTFALSSAMFASRTVLTLLIVCAAVVALLRWTRLVKAYSQAQNSLRAILRDIDETGATPASSAPRSAASADSELAVMSAVLAGGSPVAGKELRALRLAQRTGATLVGIVRDNRQLANPGPKEKLAAGDRLFFLGTPEQTRAARALLEARG